MNILIDATWIGGMYGSKVMHGGLRVTNEFLKRLGNFKQHTFYLTNTNYLEKNINTLKKYVSNEIGTDNVKVQARDIKLLNSANYTRLYSKVSRYVPIPYIYPFVSLNFRGSIDVYHAPVDPIPGIIRHNKRIKKFFTALDLIPLVRPDLSNNFYDYTKKLYDSLTPDINILAISQSTKNDILKYRNDLHPDKIRVTYLGADEKLFYNIPEKDRIQKELAKSKLQGKKYVLTINSMARYKNVEFILDNYFAFIREHGIEDLHLVVIGQNRETNYKEYVENKYGKYDRVLFFDYLDDDALVYLYNGALAFLYMSHYEGFGLPILEAMQCGTPVICSNTSSMPEVAGNAALLASPNDNETFQRSLNEVYHNAELANRLKFAGLEQAKKFSWSKYAEEVVRAYEEM
ncbi:glycosyltransferase family 4 protein [Longitalea arenae]|uniref:glycosyltransferase family 4 protein n=1 Tax=Longitalea arenae TaxID=2812558 RepID=UPI0019689A6C|nr:glycosyltransferase family 1 protein [Longitalea arenae]